MDDYNFSPEGLDYDPDLLMPDPDRMARRGPSGNQPRPNRPHDSDRLRYRGDESRGGAPAGRAPESRGAGRSESADASRRRVAADDVRREQRPAAARPRRQKADAGRLATDRKPFANPFRGVWNFFCDKRTHAVFGVGLICLALYIVVSAISFLRYGVADQSVVTSMDLPEIAADGTRVGNHGGPLGAVLAQSVFAQGLGLGSLVLIVYLVVIGLGLMGIRKCHFWSATFKTLLVGITVSMVLGLAGIWLGLDINLGGTHGRYVNLLIHSYADWIGALLVSVLLVVAVVYVYINDLLKLYNKYAAIRRARRERAEQERVEQEEARQRAREAMENSELNSEHEAETVPEEEDYDPFNEPRTVEEVGFDASPREALIDEAEATEARLSPTEPEELSGDEDVPSDDPEDEPVAETAMPPEKEEAEEDAPSSQTPSSVRTAAISDPGFEVFSTEIEKADVKNQELYDPTAELSRYVPPSLDLLHEASKKASSVDREEQEENKDKITKTLNDYGIQISHIEATVGPTVTLYEIIPAEGVRIAKIRRLEDDIAMSLAALGIRIIAPIPGKGTIGIEVPNKDPQMVAMRSILESRAYQECKYKLPMALGATISNDVYIADLAKMPHLLVAGATGMGKSVGLNAIIASLLYRKHPAELKFVLIDPKMVEFSLYGVLERHFLAKLPDEEDAVVTDMDKVVRTLNSLCVEMDQRYMLLRDANVRSITEYNERFVKRMLNPEKGHRYLPYIVMIVDEFADLIMTAGKQVETPIARIAQKARAVGMHMIVATQRPSTNVITGIIKANFPGRIAFRVAQMVDSKTILDRSGANQLIGRGDMLFSHNGSMDRVQCAFIDTDEVEAICHHIDSQAGYEHAYYLPEPIMDDGDSSAAVNLSERDSLFEEAAKFVITSGTASTSSLQRRYSIGYNRAGKIMDQLEASGVVGPSIGGKPRQVLMDTVGLERVLQTDI